MKKLFFGAIIMIFASSCNFQKRNIEKAISGITKEEMVEHVKVLASDEYQGRKPFTVGEKKTLAYLENEFKEIELEPANNGSYFQDVPMVEVSVSPNEIMEIHSGYKKINLKYKDEFVAFSHQLIDEININNADLVFAGYGIVAPEYNWNDYESIDVKNKVVVVLVNDPGFGTTNEDMFNGNAMTYYGRWTYKYEEAARQGAKGVLIIHQVKPAGYPFSVVLNGATIPKLYLQPKDNYMSRCALEGWLTLDAAHKVFKKFNIDLDEEMEKAKTKEFKAFSLGAKVNFKMLSKHKFAVTKNLLGYIKGSERPDEVIIYTAHWDHLGIGPVHNGDSIYNGAVDNGTSLAWMMEIAQAFKSLRKTPERSIMFIATTSEEQGLLGAKYYVQNPVFPLSKTVANINNDLMLPFGRYKDVMITGSGQSELEDYVAEFAKKQDRYIFPDPNPHTGMYYRADHFAFAKAGVPALFVRGNCDSREYGKEWAAKMEKNWLENYYHKPADEYDANFWDLSGTEEDAKLLFRVGYKLANEKTFPKWKEGSEFKVVREEYMSK